MRYMTNLKCIVFVGLDSTMFDSGQTSHLLRNRNILFDEEFNRAEHRNIQNCEIKRKSGNCRLSSRRRKAYGYVCNFEPSFLDVNV